jgi:hypothetical protein
MAAMAERPAVNRYLRPRTIRLDGNCRLELEPDDDVRGRYVVKFFGLRRDRSAILITESARVRLMLANLRGHAPYPYPLPERVTIGWLDQAGWHLGRSPYAEPLASLPNVRACLEELLGDLTLRVALAAANPSAES